MHTLSSMKKYIAIIICIICLSAGNDVFGQRMVGPKAEKKEQKMIKKQNKIEKKTYLGRNRKANKKRMRARKKTEKRNAKERSDK
jgi:hypothetical protein